MKCAQNDLGMYMLKTLYIYFFFCNLVCHVPLFEWSIGAQHS